MPEGYVDILEASRILGIHPNTLHLLIRKRRIPGVIKPFGLKWLIDKEKLQIFASNYNPKSYGRSGKKPWKWMESALR